MSDKTRPRYTKAYTMLSDLLFTVPFSAPLARVLAVLKIHPNVITVVSLLAGFASGILFATGHWCWAALIFQFSYFCDCVDGKVARLRGMTSRFGARLDVIADGVKKPASFLGIAVYFLTSGQVVFAILTCVALVVHVGVHKLYSFARVLEYDLEFPDFHRKVIRRFAPRLLSLYTFSEEQFIEFVIFPLIGGIIGLPQGAVWFLYGAALVTVLGLVKLCILLNHRRKGRYDEVYQDWSGTGGMLDKP